MVSNTVHRLTLGGTPIEYSEVDFLTPPLPPGPYTILNILGGAVVGVRGDNVPGTRYPRDVSTTAPNVQMLTGLSQRRQFTKGTQTDDAGADMDVTLMDVDESIIPGYNKDEKKD